MSFQQEIDAAIKEQRLYFLGDRLPSDWYEGFRMWLPMAEAGDAKAQYNIGRCYSRGDGVEKDENLCREWLFKAAAQGEPRSHFNLYIHFKDAGDAAVAADWLEKAVALGESRAVKTVQQKAADADIEKACAALGAGDRVTARTLFKAEADKGNYEGELGLIACDTEFTVTQTTIKDYFEYQDGVRSISPGVVVGGGTKSAAYYTHGFIFRAVNRSNKQLLISALTSKYHYRNPDKKIEDDERWDLAKLAAGENTERTVNLGIVQGQEADANPMPTVYFKGYYIWDGEFGGKRWIKVEFQPRQIAFSYDVVKKERRKLRLGCLLFFIAAWLIFGMVVGFRH